MTKATDHTALPWEYAPTPILADKLNHHGMVTSGHHHVATVINLQEAEANAALIVRSVNAAPALADALATMLTLRSMSASGHHVEAAKQAAREALASWEAK